VGQLDLEAPFEWRRREEALWIEVALPAAKAVFSTRAGGRSTGPYESLNLGILTDDEAELVAVNRAILAQVLGRDPAAVAMGFQVHGAEVQCHTVVPEASPYWQRGVEMSKVDAQVTGLAEVTPLVLTADCVPLVLATPGAVGAIHCGWRGVAEGIVPKALAALCELAEVGRRAVSAALGPGIGPCCYSVGPEVLAVFGERGHEQSIVDGNRLDIAQAVRTELERAGVSPPRIYSANMCTSCNPSHFFSHRRDGGMTGRQAGLAWLD
jgi:YfiH family protein